MKTGVCVAEKGLIDVCFILWARDASTNAPRRNINISGRKKKIGFITQRQS